MRILAAWVALSVLAACGSSVDDGGGGATSSPGTQSSTVTEVIDADGGTLAASASSPIAGTQAVFPAGALPGPTTITLGQITGAGGISADVLVIDLGSPGMGFAVPVALTVRYSQQYLANRGITDPATLKVVALDGTGAAGETLRTVSQNTAQRTVTAQATRAGRFAVLGYSNATLAGSYGFNFTIMDARFGSPSAIQVDVPETPFVSAVPVPFPGFAFASELGTIAFDGAGSYSWSGIRNNGGRPTAVSGSGTYAVSSEGVLGLDIGPMGKVLAGGSAFVLVSPTGDVVELGVGVKIGAGHSNASLSGSYGVAHHFSDANAGPLNAINLDIRRTPYDENVGVPFPSYAFSTELWSASFDGAGNYTWSGTRNQGGVAGPASGGGTYSVSGDGTLALSNGLTGHLQSGGAGFLLAAASGQPIAIGAGLRKSGSLSAASLGGTYAVALYYSDPGATAGAINIDVPDTPFSGAFDVPFPLASFSTELRSVTFNGAGSYTWTGTRNQGGVSSPVAGNGTYAVAADGSLTLDGGLAGNVLAGGSTFILSSSSGQALRIGVGLLR